MLFHLKSLRRPKPTGVGIAFAQVDQAHGVFAAARIDVLGENRAAQVGGGPGFIDGLKCLVVALRAGRHRLRAPCAGGGECPMAWRAFESKRKS